MTGWGFFVYIILLSMSLLVVVDDVVGCGKLEREDTRALRGQGVIVQKEGEEGVL
jgi:hypothetical protein